jgi:hypothetical protein
MSLDCWIIEEVEREREREDRPRPELEIEAPRGRPDAAPNERSDRGVQVLDISPDTDNVIDL